MQFFYLTWVLLLILKSIDGANILYLAGLPSPSHHVWYGILVKILQLCCTFIQFVYFIHLIVLNCRNRVLVNGLAAHGHNVTVISVDRDAKPPKGVHYIYLEGIYDDESIHELQKQLFTISETMNPFTEPISYNDEWYASCLGM